MKYQSKWKVPRSRNHVTNRKIRDEIIKYVEPVIFEDNWEALRMVSEFEKAFSEKFNFNYVSGVQTCSAALFLSLLALGVKSGDEVITVSNSDMATTAAISHCGATLVLCDVCESDYVIDISKVEDLITEKTRAIVPVDLYGHIADVKTLREIADKHNVFIVEDAALAILGKDYGEIVGKYADIVCFSTMPTKLVGSSGNGGIVATQNVKFYKQVELFKAYGAYPSPEGTYPQINAFVEEGYNLKMVPLDAAVVMAKLPYLDEWRKRRKEIVDLYFSELLDFDGIILPQFRDESEPVLREMPVRILKKRSRVVSFLLGKGVQVSVNYCPAAHLRPVYENLGLIGSESLPITEKLSDQIITLPVDPELSNEEIVYVCESLKEGIISEK